MSRALVQRPGFLNDLLQFDAPSIKQILGKCQMLQESPEEGGKAKARLSGRTDNLHRLRTGKFRIFYSYDEEKVSLWGVRRKTVKGQYRGKKGGDVTYDVIDEVDDDDLDLELAEVAPPTPGPETWLNPHTNVTPLPEPITSELLVALSVPTAFHARLLAITDQDALLNCPGVPEDYLLAVDRHMFEEPISLRADEPELIAPGGINDLLRFTEGEIVPFLLKLNPEQSKFVKWAAEGRGPTLVKGGPGTGKSTVAIYRAREMIHALRESGIEEPRILFTTYTRALVTFSAQLLDSLLGDDASCVDVRTADSLVGTVLNACGHASKRPNASQRERLRTTALERIADSGNALQKSSRERLLERVGRRYLFEEIETVIQARGIGSVDEYLAAPRPGRRVRLTQTQRGFIWEIAAAYASALDKAGYQTWQQSRATAAQLAAAEESGVPSYDAVIVDEAQDLDPSALRLLVEVCVQPNRIFITADASQSIYSAGFSWKSVHSDLRFQGRTGILKANHRSTRELTEAARDYLSAGVPEELQPDAQTYVHSGPVPAVRTIESPEGEAELIARFLRGASREFRLTIGAGAVLVPDQKAGRPLAASLKRHGIPTTYRDSRSFELNDNSVTVLPLLAAKGLEFPVVAVAGFGQSDWPYIENDWDQDAEIEALITARRTMFVAMTRAMRALLVMIPENNDSMLFDGFDPIYWNT